MKTCNTCNLSKEDKEFYKDCTKYDGLQSRCIGCDGEKKKKYAESQNHLPDLSLIEKSCRCCKNIKKISQFGVCKRFKDGYDKACKECRSTREKQRYLKNAEDIKKRTNDYYYENKPKLGETRRKYQKKKMKTDPMYVLKRRLRNRLYYALKNKGWLKKNKLSEYIGCDYETLVKHIESQFKDGMSWDRQSEFHIDHIQPLDSATTEEELLKLCHYTNLQPLWGRENIKKGSKV